MLADIRDSFADLEDPRRHTGNLLHPFESILFMSVAAIICGMNDWVGIEEWCTEKTSWLRQYIPLPNGIPSHDTLSRVIGLIPPKAFAHCLCTWMEKGLPQIDQQRHIAIDGKALCGSTQSDRDGIHVVTAFASDTQLVLAQESVSGKGKEIPAITEVLEMLTLEGAVVTIDAIGAQKKITQQILKKKADYVIGLKENQRTLYLDLADHLDHAIREGCAMKKETFDKGHGRREERNAWLTPVPEWFLENCQEWSGLRSIGAVDSKRIIKGRISEERRYFICSLTDIERFTHVVREHWSIENKQHWILDVQFLEDANRSRKDYRAANLAILRRISLNLLRRNPSKRSMRGRRLLACLNDQALQKILFGEEA